MTVFVFFATATGTRIIAADFWGGNDRLLLFLSTGIKIVIFVSGVITAGRIYGLLIGIQLA